MSLQTDSGFGWLANANYSGAMSPQVLNGGGRGATTAQSSVINGNLGIKFDASTQVPTASENRPRNIAFNFLVRAK